MKTRFASAGAAIVLLALVFGLNPLRPANATHEPANKVSAAGATTEVVSPDEEVVLLSETVKTSKPTDLILGVTAECAITTEVTTVGNDNQQAEGTVKIWVEIDGVPVKVAEEDTTEPGKVVFCNRLYQRETSLFEDEDATIRTFMETRAANGFNWMALNVGSATHTIVVKARLTVTEPTAKTSALAAIGKRTLIVEPVKASNHEAVTALG